VSGLKWQENKTLHIFNHKVYWKTQYIFKHWTSVLLCSRDDNGILNLIHTLRKIHSNIILPSQGQLYTSTKFLMCLVHLNISTISGTTYSKTILSFLPRTGREFIGMHSYSSNDSVMPLIHILHFFTINNIFHKPPELKIQRSQMC